MPARTTPLVNEQIYHIYNRGTEKRRIFDNKRCYSRFIQTIRYYQLEGPKPKFSNFIKQKLFNPDPEKKIVEIICYCLMPNHFHLLVKQLKDGGISEFMRKLSDSYTKYYNIKFERVGALLQGPFKAVLIETDEQLTHVSRYIHLNPLVSFLVKDLAQYEWSSYEEYINNKSIGICVKENVLGFFKSPEDYKQFVLDQAGYGQQLELIKHQLVDE
ncbi:MAG: transposase [Candidatus Daviesbacteria bacterium]|nr:MAG: transposase [Candidatus Daviesbacteria bacterium]